MLTPEIFIRYYRMNCEVPFHGTFLSDHKFRIVNKLDRDQNIMKNRKCGQVIQSIKTHILVRLCLVAKINPPSYRIRTREQYISFFRTRRFSSYEFLEDLTYEELKCMHDFTFCKRAQIINLLLYYLINNNMIYGDTNY